MSLYEEGAFELKDQVSRFIPSFADAARVPAGLGAAARDRAGDRADAHLAPAHPHLGAHLRLPPRASRRRHVPRRRLRVGLAAEAGPRRVLRRLGVDPAAVPARHRVELRRVDRRARPRVRGRRRQAARRGLRERIFEPLGMAETAFFAPEHDHDRLAALYVANPADGTALRMDAMGDAAKSPPAAFMGGGGLVSTAADYHRFCTMLLNGGELDGARVLGPHTLAYMASNHLPGARRPRGVRPPAVRRDDLRRRRLRPRLRRAAGRGRQQDAGRATASSSGAGRRAPRSGSTRPRASPSSS